MTKKATCLSTSARCLLEIFFKNPFLLGLVSALLTIIFSIFLGNILRTEGSASNNLVNFQSPMELFEIAVIVPLIETLVFQTLIIVITSKITKSKTVNLVVSGSIFGAAHVESIASLPVVLEGFALAIIPGSIFAYISFKNISEKKLKKSIIYTWVAHSTHNTAVLLLYGYPVFFS